MNRNQTEQTTDNVESQSDWVKTPVANMIRYKREHLATKRDLILALTCDEELIPTKFNGVEYLVKNYRNLISPAGFALRPYIEKDPLGLAGTGVAGASLPNA